MPYNLSGKKVKKMVDKPVAKARKSGAFKRLIKRG